MQDGEHRFFDLPGIGGAADEDEFPGEIDDDEGLGLGAVQFRHRVEVRGADNGELRGVLRQFLLVFDLHEQVAGEEVLPGLGGDDADGQAVGRVGPGVAVLHKEFLALEKGQQPVVEQVEFFRLPGAGSPAPRRCDGRWKAP